jgi:hypothetical protein
MLKMMPRIKEFYINSSTYIGKYANSKFVNPPIGVPKIYTAAYKYTGFKLKSKKKKFLKKKFVKSSLKYVFNEHLTPALIREEKSLFSPDGVNSFRHKEKSDVRIGTRKQKTFQPPEVATDFTSSFPELFSSFEEFDLTKHCVVEGCFESNRHTIQAQMDCKNFNNSAVPDLVHYNKFEKAIQDTVRKLKISPINGVDITDIQDFDFNLSTKPGYRYEHYLLKQTKAECVKEAVFLAEERYSNILSASKEGRCIDRNEIYPGVYTIGARNKREACAEAGEELTSRAVHMPEFHVELHGGMFSDLLTTKFVEEDSGPVFIGNSFLKHERFSKLLDDNHSAVEGDWKKFDSSLSNSLVTAALSICRCYFPEGLLYDNHFLAILDSLVIKDYHVVGGNVYRILHGLPSGSKWTNILGSIINLIALNYCFSSVKYHERSFAVGGDDFDIFFKYKINDLDSLCEIATASALEIGMNFKFLKIKEYKFSSNINDYPVFYKYTVFKGFPVIPLESILDRTLSPWNKRYNNNAEVLEFLDNLLPSLGYPTRACYVFYYYYQYVYYRCTGKSCKLSSIITSHFRIYDKMIKIRSTSKELKKYYEKEDKYYRNIFVPHVDNATFLKTIFQ